MANLKAKTPCFGRLSEILITGGNMKRLYGVMGLCIALGLSACGGGSSGSISTPSFPLKSAYSTLVANGYTKTYTVSGTCSGTASEMVAPAKPGAIFEGTPGFSADSTVTISLTNCTQATTTATLTSYYDTNYTPLGFNVVGGDYGVYLTPAVIPVSAVVGDSGIIGTVTTYTNSTKTTPTGREDVSYAVGPDAVNTAIVNLTFKIYDPAGVLGSTEQDRYRITTDGVITPVSKTVEDVSTPITINLTFQ
ncbi:MAG: hypothetical protein Q8K05_05195 [Polaromonas sp.]|uniref:hypothetical protein n=1 Tax=Polaromonas sp. TaxID=1869339 RepID=UPI002730438F|nr:hypothetical protein [Polaromonas sp.]MDP2255445.1 hypothetical protein [Polaromonas sp.]